MSMKPIRWLATAASVTIGVVGTNLLLQPGGSSAAQLRYSSNAESATDALANLRVPEGYRTTYEYLGSWAIADETKTGAKQIHMVYASPGTITSYRQSGRFPDGTVLVKEVYAGSTSPMTTGIVSHAERLTGWFVMVRGDNEHRADNKLWGDGWGWSWFDADSPKKTTSTDYRTDCKGCHEPAQATEWIYTRGYPVLAR